MASQKTRTTTTNNNNNTPLLTLPRALTILILLATVLPPSSPFTLPSSSSSSSSSSFSSLDKRTSKHYHHNSVAIKMKTDCSIDLEVSAICYNCAALSPKNFHTIHGRCCYKPGPVRDLCVGWYTEDPSQGRRLKYF